jgi:imidazole glycerol phosphate synthase glutamine amidotransferase subunit
MNRRVAIISYGTGNLASLSDALEAVGAECYVANTASDLAGSDALVLPGVGHFRHAMNFFRASGLLEPTLARIRSGVPTLGICLGFQLLTRSSEEAGGEAGLGLLPCATVRIRPSAPHVHKVPHLGWNTIDKSQGSPRLLTGIPSEEQIFYYANAYAVSWAQDLLPPLATYWHGSEYVGLIEQGSVFGVQFQPDKSRRQGLHLLRNLLET